MNPLPHILLMDLWFLKSLICEVQVQKNSLFEMSRERTSTTSSIPKNTCYFSGMKSGARHFSHLAVNSERFWPCWLSLLFFPQIKYIQRRYIQRTGVKRGRTFKYINGSTLGSYLNLIWLQSSTWAQVSALRDRRVFICIWYSDCPAGCRPSLLLPCRATLEIFISGEIETEGNGAKKRKEGATSNKLGGGGSVFLFHGKWTGPWWLCSFPMEK